MCPQLKMWLLGSACMVWYGWLAAQTRRPTARQLLIIWIQIGIRDLFVMASPVLMYNFLKFPINLRFIPTIKLIKKIIFQTDISVQICGCKITYNDLFAWILRGIDLRTVRFCVLSGWLREWYQDIVLLLSELVDNLHHHHLSGWAELVYLERLTSNLS